MTKATRGTYRKVDRKGYVLVFAPSHPLATKSGYVLEHRKVAWDAGILTDRTHDVHHKNHRKGDNRPENLEAKPHGEHSSEHYRERPSGATAGNAAKTHCPKDHPYDEENTYRRPDGGRDCRTCMRERCREYGRKCRP